MAPRRAGAAGRALRRGRLVPVRGRAGARGRRGLVGDLGDRILDVLEILSAQLERRAMVPAVGAWCAEADLEIPFHWNRRPGEGAARPRVHAARRRSCPRQGRREEADASERRLCREWPLLDGVVCISGASGAGARVHARAASPSFRSRRGEEEDGRWARGKMVYLHLRSAKNDYYNCYDVLQTKSSIHGVLETIFNFVMCCTQNHTFTMSCRQISLKS